MAKKATLVTRESSVMTDPSRLSEDPEPPIFRDRGPTFPVWPEYPVATKELVDRSTRGSKSFSKSELRAGYRRLG